MAEILQKLKDTQSNPEVTEGILSVSENLSYLPANCRMALAESGREYNYILLDCPPSLGMMTANALAVSDGVLIPTQAEYGAYYV